MKYIIKESKINHLVSKYLDSQNFSTYDVEDGEFDVVDDLGDNVIQYRNGFSSVDLDHSKDLIYIQSDIVHKIEKLFGLKMEDAMNSIINWLNKKYSKNLSPKSYEWMDDYGDDNQDEEDYYL